MIVPGRDREASDPSRPGARRRLLVGWLAAVSVAGLATGGIWWLDARSAPRVVEALVVFWYLLLFVLALVMTAATVARLENDG